MQDKNNAVQELQSVGVGCESRRKSSRQSSCESRYRVAASQRHISLIKIQANQGEGANNFFVCV
jgi:hypothetical protein